MRKLIAYAMILQESEGENKYKCRTVSVPQNDPNPERRISYSWSNALLSTQL